MAKKGWFRWAIYLVTIGVMAWSAISIWQAWRDSCAPREEVSTLVDIRGVGDLSAGSVLSGSDILEMSLDNFRGCHAKGEIDEVWRIVSVNDIITPYTKVDIGYYGIRRGMPTYHATTQNFHRRPGWAYIVYSWYAKENELRITYGFNTALSVILVCLLGGICLFVALRLEWGFFESV